MIEDYLGMPIEIGDTVIFPATGDLMSGVVTKIGRERKGYGYQKVYVKNQNGYTKTKYTKDLINMTRIKNGMPEYFL